MIDQPSGELERDDVDHETVELAREACYCHELDPRVIEGGGRCGTCEARDEIRAAGR